MKIKYEGYFIESPNMATDINDKKFGIFTNGLAIMEITRLKDAITALKVDIKFSRPSPYHPSSYLPSSFKETNNELEK
jgi:hypothetical protein